MSSSLDFWRDFAPLHRTLNHFFDDVAATERPRFEAVFAPRADVKETKEAYLLAFDLPGLPKEAIKIDLQDDVLTISGDRKFEKAEGDDKVHLSEIAYGNFTRSFRFPTSVDADKTEARYENGVLTVSVKKTAAPQPRQITVL